MKEYVRVQDQNVDVEVVFIFSQAQKITSLDVS